MTDILVSPAEPAKLKALFGVEAQKHGHRVATSGMVEKRGVDFLWSARDHWHGVQRKELADLYASLEDGRLSIELGQMREGVKLPMLIVERAPQWTTEHKMIANHYGQGREVTHQSWIALHLSLASQGVTVIHSKDHINTCRIICDIIHWTEKAKHATGIGRPGPTGNEWGRCDNRDWGIHLLQGFPSVGADTAARIYDTFGTVPLAWTVTREQLEAIPGIGPKRIEALLGGLRPLDPLVPCE